MPFVHLHTHSDVSTGDSLLNIKDYVRKVKESGMTACALTDHGTGAGLASFYEECTKQDIKPILGCEFYEAPDSRFNKEIAPGSDRYFHLILLVKNDAGYHNLCKLITRSNTEGFYYRPRIDMDILRSCHEGLICLSACVAGRIPTAIIRNNYEAADSAIRQYKEIFGDDFYLEIQNHGLADEVKVRNALATLARKNDVKLAATNDCHYLNTEDATAHDWLLCVKTQKQIYDIDRLKYIGDYSVKTEQQMLDLFPGNEQAVYNTEEVADKCDFHFQFGNYRMPKVYIPAEWGSDYFGYLSSLTWQGYEERYPVGHPEREQAKADLEYELGIIKQMGFAEYFLDTRKTIMWAKDHNILVGPGRGSAAGSRVCYCLRITDIDPIRYNLLFERFLNPERVSMPDIDVDYDFAHKNEIVASEAESNGIRNFAKIQTFITMQAKGVVKDVCRVAGEPPSTGNALSKMIGDCETLKEAYETNPDIKAYIESNENIRTIWDISLKLEGVKKSESLHACGHIPAPQPCEELFPCSVDQESGYLVCQYDMTQAEHLGNLKKDLLMLRNLTVIDVAQKSVKQRTGKDIPLWTEDILNDRETLRMLGNGDTDGVFQLESEGMKKVVRKLVPDSFDDIIALVALYRPGPMEMIPEYIENKHHPDKITYLTPQMEPILKNTNAIIVYQEQVMQIVRDLGGFSMGRADIVRKGIGKKKPEILIGERANFINGNPELNIPGCVSNGISAEIANEIYDKIVEFGNYSFNKSHAAAYAAISMQTAYIKCHYPQEFYAGLLSSVTDKPEKVSFYANVCRKHGVSIHAPDINSSDTLFVPGSSGGIIYGLQSIRNVGTDAAEQIVRERRENGPYRSLYDFLVRLPDINSGAITSLIEAGAFDFTGADRATLAFNIAPLRKGIRNNSKSNIDGQFSLFDTPETNSEPEMKQCEPLTVIERAMGEKRATGQFITVHPLEGINVSRNTITIAELKNAWNENRLRDPNSIVYVAGITTKVKVTYTKSKGEKMAFVTIEDTTDSTDIVVFPRVFKQAGEQFTENMIISAACRPSFRNEEMSLIADTVEIHSS